ncbi:PQQ-binding-like beta-propeller repeat protein [Streptomyces sp. MJP52]|uniref:outer membrane protein assembly factor BamB family protein n=1 Tax=Streptomyces sp. MJP52 TaxID=2940555 RepID=UPI002474647F|nr:PQQ-binding-like beta-propeller repeat protein [Streptomyces sp. MJP52]MDH6226532.1 hypothetical protein [Streptomyces sp. MJP52]
MTQPPDQPSRPSDDDPLRKSARPQDAPPPGHPAPQQPPAPPAQPPAPPAPPAGAFGAPQQPPAAGFGAPPSGYGPPQPGQPAQPGPYGQPGPYAAGPYGQPGQPQAGPYAPQPGWGRPGPAGGGHPQGAHAPYAGAPQQPPAAGSRNPFRTRPALAIGATAVAAALLIGGGVWALTGSGDSTGEKAGPQPTQEASPEPSVSVDQGDGNGGGGEEIDINGERAPGEDRVAWYKGAPDSPKGGAPAPGMWVVGDVAVKAAYKQVFGWKAANGAEAWKPVTFPAEICAVTPGTTGDGRIAVAYKSGTSDRAKCNRVLELDLRTGERGWEIEMGEGGLFDGTSELSLSLAGDSLVVGRSQSAVGYDMRTGKKRYEINRYGASCFPSGFAGDAERLIVAASCAAASDKAHDELRELDPATGKVRWTVPLNKGWEVEKVYSVTPLVVQGINRDKKQGDISVFDAGGDVRSHVGLDGKTELDFRCSGMSILNKALESCDFVLDDKNMYLATKAVTGPNEIIAVGLDSGKEQWRVKSPADASMQPVAVENGKLVAYVGATYDKGGQVVAVPTAGSHEPQELLRHPAAGAPLENGFLRGDVAWSGGRLFLSVNRLTGTDGLEEKLMMAFAK